MIRILIFLILLAGCSKPSAKSGDAKMSAAQVAAEASKLRLEPGEWETTTTVTAMNVSGVSRDATDAATGTPTITRDCVSPAQAARPPADILSGTKDGNCSYQRFSMANARIDAAMTCAPRGLPGTMAMTLAGDYAPTAFAMDMDMKTDLPGGMAMTMAATVAGRRVGACPVPAAAL